MKQTVEIDFNESVPIEVEGFTGWDKERPHHIMVNMNIGNLEINGLVEEDAEYLYAGLDRELHDETDEKREIRYKKSENENSNLRERIKELENQVDYMKNGKMNSDREELY